LEDLLVLCSRLAFVAACTAFLVVPCVVAENPPQVSLETSETLFTVLTAINTCGYDQDLATSDPLRAQIRAEVTKVVDSTPNLKDEIQPMCALYRGHQGSDPARDLSQYVSLALYLEEPPTFDLKVKQAELPPDASAIAEIVPMIKAFYEKAHLHDIWEHNRARYTALTEVYHDPLAKMTFDTEIYLKLPSAGYLGRQFTIYLDAMAGPGQTNARNYAADYYVVFAPTSATALKLQQIRHTYLHYLLDPLAMKNGGSFKRLEPLLADISGSPLDDAFKTNISLLATECLVRAVELRTLPAKTTEAERTKTLDEADRSGYVLVRYFYDALAKFEKDPTGLRSAYAGMLDGVDINKERRRVSEIQFAAVASPELLHAARSNGEHLLLNAERRLAAGDPETAQKLAQQALDDRSDDPGRALFILAQVATVNKDMEGAKGYFLQALQTARDPKVVGWSHIYLGRIFDLKEDRFAAIEEYRAALNGAGTGLPEIKLAAQKGLDQPYEPPVQRRQEE